MSYQLPLRAWCITPLCLGLGGTFWYVMAGVWLAIAVVETGMWYADR